MLYAKNAFDKHLDVVYNFFFLDILLSIVENICHLLIYPNLTQEILQERR